MKSNSPSTALTLAVCLVSLAAQAGAERAVLEGEGSYTLPVPLGLDPDAMQIPADGRAGAAQLA